MTNEITFFVLVALALAVAYAIHLLSKRTIIESTRKQKQELLLKNISAKTENLLFLLDKADRIEANIRQLNKEFYYRFGY